MSVLALKLLACGAMLADHIGAVLFPQALWLRAVGRLAMPIFCFLIANGLCRTRSARAYLLRLGAFALLSQVPYALAFYGRPDVLALNIFFTLLLGAGASLLFARFREKNYGLALLAVLAAGTAAELLGTDYGFLGVLLVFGYSLVGQARGKQALLLVVITFFMLLGGQPLVQGLAALAAVPIWFYNGRLGYARGSRAAQYAFYAFYPLHLLLLWALAAWVF